MKLLTMAKLASVSAALSVTLLGAAPAQAGLLDFLFGGGDGFGGARPTYQPSYGGSPLGVRVNPRRARKIVPAASRGQRPARTTRTANRVPAPKIDPVKNPSWYLTDQTLRRGDIVVLKTGVVVFEGGRSPFASEDFTALDKSRLVSKTERDRIQKMAPRTTESDETPQSRPATTARETPPREAALSQPGAR